MSSRQSLLLPLLLMALGLLLIVAAFGWAWWKRSTPPALAMPSEETEPSPVPVQYRPLDSDWWLVFDEAQRALNARVRQQISTFDPATPTLPADYPAPQAMAASGALRLWQFAGGTALPALPATTLDGRWHRETLADATVLFWLPTATQTTSIDRVHLPAAGTGMLHRRWLQQRLGWTDHSCDALPALLQQLPEQVQLQFGKHDDTPISEPASTPSSAEQHLSVQWQLLWPELPASLAAALLQVGAPQAHSNGPDRWFWREANLATLSRPTACPPAASGAGFVARLWQRDTRWHAALARPGATTLQGFPVLLPAELQLQTLTLANGQGLSSDSEAEAWLRQQSFATDSGLLLAVEHRGDGDFAGMSLQLRARPPAMLQLLWQWPLP